MAVEQILRVVFLDPERPSPVSKKKFSVLLYLGNSCGYYTTPLFFLH